MKVRDLIAKLQELDQDKYIVIGAYEGGCDFPNHISKCMIILNQNTEWYYGKHAFDYEYMGPDRNAYLLINKDP